MALRNAKVIKVADFLGLQTFASAENLPFGWFTSSNNVVVSNDGSAEVLRSPADFNTALSVGSSVLSAFDYNKNTGNLILFDENIGGAGVSSVRTFSTTGGANTTIRSNQADARWKRLTVNDMAYGVNGSEFIQTDGTNVYSIGITSAAAAPSVSFVAGGAGSLLSGVTVSYAYRNATTKHVSQPSPASANTGVSAGNLNLRIGVVASTQTGVDGIVLFITVDGGSVRYLYITAAGDPVVNANTTGNIDISLALLVNLDTLTPETAYNAIPPTDAYFMFRWKDRLCLCDFRGATSRQQIQYSSYETVFYGIPWESWWPLNIINIPNKGDSARAGIETPLGALVLAEQDAYLIDGELSDKVSGPEAAVSITEHMQPLRWSIGTRSPYSLATTPFGEIWLDQNKRIQLWDRNGFPVEAGLPIRTSLNAIQDTAAARNMAQGIWFQYGDEGGIYALTASTTGTTNDKLFILTIYRDPETAQLRFACGLSDIAAQCLVVAQVSGDSRFFIGAVDRLREIFASTTAGAGWTAGQTRAFSMVLGSADQYAYWHSVKFDASSVTGLTIAISDLDGSKSQNVEYSTDTESGGAYQGALDSYGYRKLLTFTFSSDDTTLRVIQSVEARYGLTRRLL